jgi:acetyltransferase-like isoleucine patch superfamily enzyme
MIKKGCFIGSNSTIIQGITIEDNSIIGAGKVVKKNLPKNSFYK